MQGRRRAGHADRWLEKFVGGECHTWTEDEIAVCERQWSIGTTVRLAIALLLYTDQRRSDVVRMSCADVQDGMIGVVPCWEKSLSKSKDAEERWWTSQEKSRTKSLMY